MKYLNYISIIFLIMTIQTKGVLAGEFLFATRVSVNVEGRYQHPLAYSDDINIILLDNATFKDLKNIVVESFNLKLKKAKRTSIVLEQASLVSRIKFLSVKEKKPLNVSDEVLVKSSELRDPVYGGPLIELSIKNEDLPLQWRVGAFQKFLTMLDEALEARLYIVAGNLMVKIEEYAESGAFEQSELLKAKELFEKKFTVNPSHFYPNKLMAIIDYFPFHLNEIAVSVALAKVKLSELTDSEKLSKSSTHFFLYQLEKIRNIAVEGGADFPERIADIKKTMDKSTLSLSLKKAFARKYDETIKFSVPYAALLDILTKSSEELPIVAKENLGANAITRMKLDGYPLALIDRALKLYAKYFPNRAQELENRLYETIIREHFLNNDEVGAQIFVDYLQAIETTSPDLKIAARQLLVRYQDGLSPNPIPDEGDHSDFLKDSLAKLKDDIDEHKTVDLKKSRQEILSRFIYDEKSITLLDNQLKFFDTLIRIYGREIPDHKLKEVFQGLSKEQEIALKSAQEVLKIRYGYDENNSQNPGELIDYATRIKNTDPPLNEAQKRYLDASYKPRLLRNYMTWYIRRMNNPMGFELWAKSSGEETARLKSLGFSDGDIKSLEKILDESKTTLAYERVMGLIKSGYVERAFALKQNLPNNEFSKELQENLQRTWDIESKKLVELAIREIGRVKNQGVEGLKNIIKYSSMLFPEQESAKVVDGMNFLLKLLEVEKQYRKDRILTRQAYEQAIKIHLDTLRNLELPDFLQGYIVQKLENWGLLK